METGYYVDWALFSPFSDYYMAKPKPPRGRWVVIFRLESDGPQKFRGKRFSSLSKARRFLRAIRFGVLRRWHAKDWRGARWES